MVTTFKAGKTQIYVTTKKGELYYITLNSFVKYIPFTWDGEIKIFKYPSLQALFLEVLNDVWNDNPTLFKKKLFTIYYSYNGEPKKVSYNKWIDGRRQYLKMIKYNIYTNILPDFNPSIK